MNYTYLTTPIGQLLLAGDEQGLSVIGFPSGKGRVQPQAQWQESEEHLERAIEQLLEYFDGRRRNFSLKLCPTGTPFQRQVLDALTKIPFGETCSYRDIAQAIGRHKAVRAVGAANGRNPLPIVIPCHRVIGADGTLTGFGGGLDAKRWLLAHEDLKGRLLA